MQKNSVLHVSRKKKKIAHTCKNEFYWTIVGYSLLVLVHFWMSNQPKEFFVFDTMFLPPKNKQIYSMWEKTYPPSQSVFPAKKYLQMAIFKKKGARARHVRAYSDSSFPPGGVVCECIKV